MSEPWFHPHYIVQGGLHCAVLCVLCKHGDSEKLIQMCSVSINELIDKETVPSTWYVSLWQEF